MEGVGVEEHEETGFVVTFWERLVSVSDVGELSGFDIADSLRGVHRGLRSHEGPLPSFRYALSLASSVSGDDERMAALAGGDRDFLRRAFAGAARRAQRPTVLGAAAPRRAHEGNVVATRDGPVWIDFEGACAGALEWDLASLRPEAAAAFDSVDDQLLDLLRVINSARVAIWCWARGDLPSMREHAEHHLGRVRAAFLE